MERIETFVDLFDYDVSKCTKLRTYKIHLNNDT